MKPGTVKVTIDKLFDFKDAVKRMGLEQVLVGVPEGPDRTAEEGESGGISNASLAYLNEVGSPAQNIPPRPFLVPGVEKVRGQAVEVLRVAGAREFDYPGSVDQGLTKVGLMARDAVKGIIATSEGLEGLKKKTIKARERKGFAGKRPLLRTGQLQGAVTFVKRRR